MLQINNLIQENKFQEAVDTCSNLNCNRLALLLADIYKLTLNKINKTNVKIMLLCNWCSTEELTTLWNKMNYLNSGIELVLKDPDFWVIINAYSGQNYNKKRSIVFRMEPRMIENPNIWGEWANPKDEDFLRVLRHEKGDFNNCEWHLSKSCTELLNYNPIKTKIFSTVLSDKYRDVGQVKRIDFVKFLEKKGMDIDVYGNNKWDYKNFKGTLPYHKKDDAIFPYKYTFNCENNSIFNYFTEKLLDGILGECLTFYWGCPNIPEYINPKAFVKLELSNFEEDYNLILRAIKEDWYSQRLPYIREAKQKILTEMQFIPRIKQVLQPHI